MKSIRSVITGTGSYIPTVIKKNSDFLAHNFYGEDGVRISTDQNGVIQKFQQITGISERRYASEDIDSSGMASIAAAEALKDASCDPETIDQVIVAHNFGNIIKDTFQTDVLPPLASRVKHTLQIKNPKCIPYDILFGCPGWIQGVIQSDAYFKAGIAKKCLVIGTETLSRVLDDYDRDSMIFSDGAAACILEAREATENGAGILSTAGVSHCMDEVDYLYYGGSFHPDAGKDIRYLKMKGRKVFEYALKHVPQAMKDCLDSANVAIKDLKKVFLHQANEKMDESIIKSMYKLYGINEIPKDIMPMSIQLLGNSSVATVPTLFDSVRKNKMNDHSLKPGDLVLFASVGAGMNINAFSYRI
ncbi:MAG: ketoacyl-ACP synthase III [Ferruginibacter sp.]